MDKKQIGILGGTGMVGRNLAKALVEHPFFCCGPVIGSSKSAGKLLKEIWIKKEDGLLNHYGNSIWHTYLEFPESLNRKIIDSVENVKISDCKYIISCISPKYGYIEEDLKNKGFIIISISPFKRISKDTLLTVIEYSKDEIINLIKKKEFSFYKINCKKILKTPNCVVCGVSVVLKTLAEKVCGIKDVSITTFQSLSGRGDAYYNAELIKSNVYPLRNAEETTENNIKEELKFLLGISNISVSAYRVPVQQGHLIDVRCNLKENKNLTINYLTKIFENYDPLYKAREEGALPSLYNSKPIIVLKNPGMPRPRTHTSDEISNQIKFNKSIVIGNINLNDSVFDLSFSLCINNVSKGAWLGALSLLEYTKWIEDNLN